jgi:aryl-alcohol dehydrogenase-like predicted oxidoreductase
VPHRPEVVATERPRPCIASVEVEQRQLANTDLRLTPVGIGTAPIGSGRDWPVWWGPQDQAESTAAIHRALDLGVNWIDTAPFYGWGRAEEIVGRALNGRRDNVLLFTKCGTFPDESGSRMDLRPQSIRADVEASLHRLRTDRVDLLQVHDVDAETPIEESWGEVQRLIGEGKVRYGGISNHPPEAVERALAVGPVGALQYQYSLLYRSHERDILPLAERHGIGVLTWSPLAGGFLADDFDVDTLDADDFRRRHPFAQLALEPLHRALRVVGERHGRSAAQVALAWVLHRPAVAGAIVGIRNESEAEQLSGAADLQLDPAELQEIESAAP